MTRVIKPAETKPKTFSSPFLLGCDMRLNKSSSTQVVLDCPEHSWLYLDHRLKSAAIFVLIWIIWDIFSPKAVFLALRL